MQPPTPPPGGSALPPYKRWHDQDFHTSELVQLLGNLSPTSQMLLSMVLTLTVEELLATRGKTNYIARMDWDKILGIAKSKRGRRWYDEEPITHKAFNLLYTLTEADQALVTQMLYAPARLVSHYEAHCQASQAPVEDEQVFEIVEAVFREGPEIARQRFETF